MNPAAVDIAPRSGSALQVRAEAVELSGVRLRSGDEELPVADVPLRGAVRPGERHHCADRGGAAGGARVLAAGMGPGLFAPLLDFLAQGREPGLHLVVARSANGVARGMNDPLLRRLLEANTPALMLSCPPAEGAFLGSVKPRLRPPGRGLYVTRRGAVQVQTAVRG